MSDHDLYYPGDLVTYQVGPRKEDDSGNIVAADHPYAYDADFWSVYVRPNTGDLAGWLWIADFANETDAREFAAWQAKRN